MTVQFLSSSPRPRPLLPFLSGFYTGFAEPLAWVGFRVLIGGALFYEGIPKMMAPLAQVGFVENIGFYPGWLWSPMLAAMQFFGGLMIAAGLLTRPMALANAVMLAITLWFHLANPYGHAFLSAEGIAQLRAHPEFFTPEGLRRLAGGGTAFLDTVQDKANMLSLIWAGGAAFFAAFGAGRFSIDRDVLQREF